ncbi:hypothetical protein [Paenibacillus sp. YN15]|uniref:hypothetical protein n=1 Tax=Paenibacillus sp. YN15 TaxID=1742774 RepID=UPI0015EBDCE9|nr:hypothetical protein [Paenibacillus sp. YN15]
MPEIRRYELKWQEALEGGYSALSSTLVGRSITARSLELESSYNHLWRLKRL